MPIRGIYGLFSSEQNDDARLQVGTVLRVTSETEDPYRFKRGFNREQAADYCGVSMYKVAIAVRQNVLPARRHGKDVVVFREDLDAWMEGWEFA